MQSLFWIWKEERDNESSFSLSHFRFGWLAEIDVGMGMGMENVGGREKDALAQDFGQIE
jgi:hypothetical protein